MDIAHDGLKKYTCSYCGESFGRPHCLQMHVVNYHEPEKKLKCQRCPKSFASATQLTKHIEIVHEGIKRFKCEKCDRPFGTKNTLERHIMVWTFFLHMYPKKIMNYIRVTKNYLLQRNFYLKS